MAALALAACSSSDGSSTSSSEPVKTSGTAEYVVRDIYDGVIVRNILDQLPNSNFSDYSLNGVSGSASATGSKSYTTGISCGADCVKSYFSVDVTITFTNFAVHSADNTTTTLSGTIIYTESSSSTQSGLSYYSSSSVVIYSNGNVSYLDEEDSNQFAYKDTFIFDASGSDVYSLSGTLTTKRGDTYSF